MPISLESLYAFDQESGYRIHRADYELPPLDLTDDERVALHLAVTAVRLEGAGESSAQTPGASRAGRDALLKLGGLEGVAAPTLAALPDVPGPAGTVRRLPPEGPGGLHLPGRPPPPRPLRDHLPQRSLVRGRVRPRPRRHPGLPGRPDRIRDRARAGRCLRAPGRLRAGLGAAGRAVAIRRRGAGRGARAGVGHPGGMGRGRPRRAGGGRTARRRLGGREAGVTNREAFRSFVIGLLDHAEVLAPAELRADMVAWLTACASRVGGGVA